MMCSCSSPLTLYYAQARRLIAEVWGSYLPLTNSADSFLLLDQSGAPYNQQIDPICLSKTSFLLGSRLNRRIRGS